MFLTRNKEQRIKNKEQRTENREQRTENREQRTENREQRTIRHPNASTTEPMTTKAHPIMVFHVSFSPRNITASSMAKATLSLSTGATFDAGPSWSAR